MHHPTPAIRRQNRTHLLLGSGISLCLLFSSGATAEMAMDHSMHMKTNATAMDHAQHMHGAESASAMDHSGAHTMQMDHSAHMKMLTANEGYERTTNNYALPDVALTDANGNKVQLASLLADDKPVILNFIFTSCTTVCPILTATVAQANKDLDVSKVTPTIISVSIDPEYDTPERLHSYAERYKAGKNWHFLTGKLDDVITLQRAFAAYYGNKLNHKPVSFLRKGPEASWVRLEGFTTSAELVDEYRALIDTHS